MNDLDFLKEFGKNLDRERPHEPSDAQWANVKAALDKESERNRCNRLIFIWAIPTAATVLLAVLSGFLWKSMERAGNMQAEIERLEKVLETKNDVTFSDSSTRHLVVIQYDTIYRTVVLQTTQNQYKTQGINTSEFAHNADILPDKSQELQTQNISSDIAGNKAPVQQKSDNTSLTNKVENSIIQIADTLNNTSEPITISQIDDSQEIEPGSNMLQTKLNASSSTSGFDAIEEKNVLAELPPKNITTPKSHYKRFKPTAFEMAMDLKAPINAQDQVKHRFSPKDAMVSITSGLLFPQTKEAIPRNSYSLGINGQFTLGRNFRIVAGAEHGSTSFTAKSSALDNSNIPQPPSPPTPDDVFDHVQVDQPLWDFTLGMRYIFSPHKQFLPFIGASWLAEQPQEQILRYNFKNQQTDEETIILVPHNDAPFNANGFQIGMGAEWQFGKQLNLGLEAQYQRLFKNSEPLLAERIGLKASLGYRF
ncbi:MAG: hypothetical protein R3A50_14365 [Saprospiraceae bacterium]